MELRRLAKHLFAFRDKLPASVLSAVEEAIARGEATHGGQVRFAVEGTLDAPALFAGQSARERAIEVFSLLRIWDTEENNGVLIYLLLADRDIEIVADRGINAKVAPGEWERICRAMESRLSRGAYEEAIVQGIGEVSQLLASHYPGQADRTNELPDKAVVL